MQMYRDTWAEINLSHIAHNVKATRKLIGSQVRLLAVVKADAYGHGAVRVSRTAILAGADWLGVATLDEALTIRRGGICAPVLVLGYVSPMFANVAAEHDVTLTVVSVEHARALKESQCSKTLSVHLKVDTGMGRLGVLSPEDVAEVVRILDGSRVRLTGAFTHFAQADSLDKSHANGQLDAVRRAFECLVEAGPIREELTFHAANSAAIIDMPESYFDMVRIGISLYGVYPSDEVKKDRLNLRQALSLYTRVVHVKRVPAGTTIGYGSTYVTDRETLVATLPIGYADGLFRSLSNRGFVKIGSVRCPIIGRVCMDQVMIDASCVPSLQVGDVVTVYDEETLPELARLAGTIPYELLCAISPRVPRVYVGEAL
jgi:alanine racemase